MGIQHRSGDLFATGAQTLVMPVNCVGVAGCGLALQCKQRYPWWFREYRAWCLDRALWLGYPLLHQGRRLWIMDFPTKRHYRESSDLMGVEMGLMGAVRVCRRYGVVSIAFPKLGCGAGGLSWEAVKPLMEYYLGQVACDVLIYE